MPVQKSLETYWKHHIYMQILIACVETTQNSMFYAFPFSFPVNGVSILKKKNIKHRILSFFTCS